MTLNMTGKQQVPSHFLMAFCQDRYATSSLLRRLSPLKDNLLKYTLSMDAAESEILESEEVSGEERQNLFVRMEREVDKILCESP
jgi:hypothetical protein